MERKKHEIWAVLILMLTLLVFFSLISFHADDAQSFADAWRKWPHNSRNWVGPVGAVLSYRLLGRLGLGAYALPLLGVWVSWCLFRRCTLSARDGIQSLGAVLFLFSGIALTANHLAEMRVLNQSLPHGTGGEVGQFIYDLLDNQLSGIGAHVVLIGMLLVGLLVLTPYSLGNTAKKTTHLVVLCFRFLGRFCKGILEVFSAVSALIHWFSCGIWSGVRSIYRAIRKVLLCLWTILSWVTLHLYSSVRRMSRRISNLRFRMNREAVPEKTKVGGSTSMILSSPPSSDHELPPQLVDSPPIKKSKRKTVKADALFGHPGLYSLPTLGMLDSFEPDDHRPDRKLLETNARILEEKLSDFGVQGKVTDISPGPVITMYEYTPAPGIKISRIVSLTDDLSMALKATSIRVVAPIPGKAAIGIELPNPHRETVTIRAILESEVFANSSAPLTIALGKDITGQPVVTNLARMPHLLIAGATGTGKSVCLNTILASLLFRNTPEDMRLLLIDPKRIELKCYEEIPHLLSAVVNDAKAATKALQWAVREMEKRYRLLADKNVRNIEGYNRALAREKSRENKSAASEAADPAIQHQHLHYLVIIIDELADLMMVASRDVEESITRLAQMARAAGIHLILATQRPSVDVLTGIIKANIPTRISFQVSSRVDSRTILDASGAESLLGSGDMLFLPPGTAKMQRIHGAFISEKELEYITSHWREQKGRDNNLLEQVDFQNKSDADEPSDDDLDPKYDEAVELVLETRQASISMLQRRLRVGYNRAARMIEMMEKQGIVGPSDGVKPREVHGRSEGL